MVVKMIFLKLYFVNSMILSLVLTLPINTQEKTAKNQREVIGVMTTESIEVDFDNKAIRNNLIDVRNDGLLRSLIRPGMRVTRYDIQLTPNINTGTFEGRLQAQIAIIDINTREQDLILYARDLTINSVSFTFVPGAEFSPAEFEIDEENGILIIDTGFDAMSYTVIVEYEGSLHNHGQGFFIGSYGDDEYIAMNLYPTNARRVFPSMDELTQPSLISFSFNNIQYSNVVMNSVSVVNSPNEFVALQGPPLLWSMIAHSFNNINIPIENVLLYIRPQVTNQESQASVAINYYFENLNEWTNTPYFGIVLNQRPQLQIVALPDVSRDWYGLSSVALWEPYILMENTCSVKQRFTALSKIAEALARQWFGYVIYPENFRYQWVVSGLASYAGFDVLREFQTDTFSLDITMLDINTLFVTEVIQESLLRDGYIRANVLEPRALYEENAIRDHLYGIVKYKAPAILRMLRLVLGPDNDYVQSAGRSLIAMRSFETVNVYDFVDAVNSQWLSNGTGTIDDVGQFLTPYIQNNGYPVLSVELQEGGVSLTTERFRYQQSSSFNYVIPLTYTVSNAPDYNDTNIYPTIMLNGSDTLSLPLDDDDVYVLFNIQGQGYYRVHYDSVLWERIIDALDDPDRRAEIHPLNRATLLDDVLNLARGGRVEYETAFQVALTWQHETEYAPWKAYVRNMEFLRKRLVALGTDSEEFDPDIYLRLVNIAISAFEDEVGFSPDPQILEPALTSLTRGLVMNHACKANYQPCIAAAIDWFYDSSQSNVINPNIPKDIRPAVYCTMVREGDNDVIQALNARLEIEPSMWERVVILESLACSSDSDYTNNLLMETISASSPYSPEERVKIFTAVAESSYENAQTALQFLNTRANDIRNTYGGDEKLEEVIHALIENMASPDVTERFTNVINAQNNNLDDARYTAVRATQIARENVNWDNLYMEEVYEWINENDAPTLMVSFILIAASLVISLFNH